MPDVVISSNILDAYKAWVHPELIAYVIDPGGRVQFDVEDKGDTTVPVGFFAEYSVDNVKIYIRTKSRTSVALLDLGGVIKNPAASIRVGSALGEALSMKLTRSEANKRLSQALSGVQKLIHPLLMTCKKLSGKYDVSKGPLPVNLYDVFFNRSVNGCGNSSWMASLVRLIAEDKRDQGVDITDPLALPTEEKDKLLSTFSNIFETADPLITSALIRLNMVLIPNHNEWFQDELKEAAVNVALVTDAYSKDNVENKDMDEGQVLMSNLITLSESSGDDVLPTYHDFVNVEGDPTSDAEAIKLADAYYNEYRIGSRGASFAVLAKSLSDASSKGLTVMRTKKFADMAEQIASQEEEEPAGNIKVLLPASKILKSMTQVVRKLKI